MHLIRSGLPICTAVFATASITMHMVAEWSVAQSIPPCISESSLSDPFPTENPCSEKVLTLYSLSNLFEAGSTQNLLRKFFLYHLRRSSVHLAIFSSFVFPAEDLGLNGMNGIALSFSITRSLVA